MLSATRKLNVGAGLFAATRCVAPRMMQTMQPVRPAAVKPQFFSTVPSPSSHDKELHQYRDSSHPLAIRLLDDINVLVEKIIKMAGESRKYQVSKASDKALSERLGKLTGSLVALRREISELKLKNSLSDSDRRELNKIIDVKIIEMQEAVCRLENLIQCHKGKYNTQNVVRILDFILESIVPIILVILILGTMSGLFFHENPRVLIYPNEANNHGGVERQDDVSNRARP